MSKSLKYQHGSTLSDETLVEKYLSTNDLEWLGMLYQRYTPLVYGVCLKYYKDREDSQDAVMQIFEKLIIEVGKHQIEKFRPWLYVLTKHYCLRQLQNKTSELHRFEKFSGEQIMESDNYLSPLDEEPEKNMNKALQECLEKLKKEQKVCVELFYYNEKCYQEISDQMNIPLNKVKSYIQNGKRNLKICLENNHG
ncbi:MAG: sigma-70 family RNA polymerase sigma factor [Bacteroidales bacterium]|nr:sigma-70 family RNA polymerase sigma factor [Bacteroidales bacterium]